jgi:hypothetical protein
MNVAPSRRPNLSRLFGNLFQPEHETTPLREPAGPKQ